MTVRTLVDAAADVQVKAAATAMELPGRIFSAYAGVRRDGLRPSLESAALSAAGSALKLTVAAVTLPLEVAERLRAQHRASDLPTFADEAVAAGAPGTAKAVVSRVERETLARQAVREAVSVTDAAVEVPDHDDLPLPDYDHMTLGSLRSRMSKLTIDELLQIRAYEQAHANRLAVVTMLENRIAKLRREQA